MPTNKSFLKLVKLVNVTTISQMIEHYIFQLDGKNLLDKLSLWYIFPSPCATISEKIPKDISPFQILH